MKTMSCIQLGGVCEEKFSAQTFDELAIKARIHGTNMAIANDKPHLAVIEKIMQKPNGLHEWMLAKNQEFDKLPND